MPCSFKEYPNRNMQDNGWSKGNMCGVNRYQQYREEGRKAYGALPVTGMRNAMFQPQQCRASLNRSMPARVARACSARRAMPCRFCRRSSPMLGAKHASQRQTQQQQQGRSVFSSVLLSVLKRLSVLSLSVLLSCTKSLFNPTTTKHVLSKGVCSRQEQRYGREAE